VLVGASFATLRALALVPLAAAALLVWRDAASPAANGDRADGRGAPSLLATAGPFVVAAAYALTGSAWTFWLLAVPLLTSQVFAPAVPAAPEEAADARWPLMGVAAVCVAAALLTAGARRPDTDDAYFVNAAVSALRDPGAPLHASDGMYRDGVPPVVETLHMTGVYELLIAVLAGVSGLAVPILYYVVLPPLWAALGMVAHWVVLRRLLPRAAALGGLGMLLLLLLLWGDGDRTFGNFGLVRLFQGKAVYLVVVLPAVVLAALRFREAPSRSSWTFLALSQCAAAGMTTNALLVAPLAAGLALAARPPFGRDLLAGVAASLPLAVLAVAAYLRVAAYPRALDFDPLLPGYETMLGTSRTPLVLLALVAVPALASWAGLRRARWLSRWVWLAVVALLLPASAALAARVLGNVFSWRLLWALPVPLLVSVAAGLACDARAPRPALRRAVLAAWIAAFAWAGPWAISSDDWSWSNVGRPKVADEPYAAAELVARVASPTGRAVVPEAVAVLLVGMPDAPPLVAVRALYLAKLDASIPPVEFATRMNLLLFAEGLRSAPPLERGLALVDAERIATLAFPERHRDAAGLEAALVARGFVIHRAAGFVVATRAP
jgi:hypothetical protein